MKQAWLSLGQHCVTAARQIADECSRLVRSSDGAETTAASSGLAGCDAPLIELLGRQASNVVRLREASSGGMSTDLTARRLDDIISISYRKFYAYRYSELPACWRQLYTDASILKFALLFLRLDCDHRHQLPKTCLDELIRTFDLALIKTKKTNKQQNTKKNNQTQQHNHTAWVV